MKELLKTIEDMRIGYLAKERDQKTKPNDYVELDKIHKKRKARKRLQG